MQETGGCGRNNMVGGQKKRSEVRKLLNELE